KLAETCFSVLGIIPLVFLVLTLLGMLIIIQGNTLSASSVSLTQFVIGITNQSTCNCTLNPVGFGEALGAFVSLLNISIIFMYMSVLLILVQIVSYGAYKLYIRED
ncbi:MAG TPA: hypothetical protein VNF06_01825, partial [Candidatus Aquilonibacter sp.]|nr:hypothetical protein [Candidatus Aquilonibacter sp.]